MLSGAKNALADMMLINKATTTTNTPVSGPQLTEIADACRESDDHCKSIIDQIEKRLDKDNVTIKFKCLKIIMHLIENGNTSFTTFMADKLSCLKPTLSYTGPADPLRGIEPYTALHTLGQQVISLITSKNDNSYIAQPTRQANALFGGSNKPKVDPKIIPNKDMVGLGSTSYTTDNKKSAEDWTQKAKNLGQGSNQPNTVQTNNTTPNLNTLPSNVGNNAVGKPSYAPPQSLIQKQKATYQQMAGSANSDGTYERGLVNELCQPGGMRPIPPKDKLVQFTKHAKTLDPLLIGPILLSKLNDENWQVQSKCLYVIENIISIEDNTEYNNYFKENTDELDYLILNGKPQVQKKAGEVKDLLFNVQHEKIEEFDDKEEEEPVTRQIQQNIPGVKPNIDHDQEDLFMDMDTNTAHIAKPPPPQVDNDDLFGGLAVNTNTPAPANNNIASNIPALAPTEPAPQPPQAPQTNQMNKLSDDLLNNLDFGGPSGSDSFSAFNNVPTSAMNQNMFGMNQYQNEMPPNTFNHGYGIAPSGPQFPNPAMNYQNIPQTNPYGVPNPNPYSAPPGAYMNPQSYPQTMPGMYGYQPTQPNYPAMPQIYSGVMNPAYNQVRLPSNYKPPANPGQQQIAPRPANPPPQKKPDRFSDLLGDF